MEEVPPDIPLQEPSNLVQENVEEVPTQPHAIINQDDNEQIMATERREDAPSEVVDLTSNNNVVEAMETETQNVPNATEQKSTSAKVNESGMIFFIFPVGTRTVKC